MDCPRASLKASPLATSITPSVAINGGTLKRVITAPDSTPNTVQTATPAALHPASAARPALAPPPTSLRSSVTTTADSAIRLPTDKSMPPVIITTVIPAARIDDGNLIGDVEKVLCIQEGRPPVVASEDKPWFT